MEVVEWNKRWFPPFPCYPMSRQCPWKKTLIKKCIFQWQSWDESSFSSLYLFSFSRNRELAWSLFSAPLFLILKSNVFPLNNRNENGFYSFFNFGIKGNRKRHQSTAMWLYYSQSNLISFSSKHSEPQLLSNRNCVNHNLFELILLSLVSIKELTRNKLN